MPSYLRRSLRSQLGEKMRQGRALDSRPCGPQWRCQSPGADAGGEHTSSSSETSNHMVVWCSGGCQWVWKELETIHRTLGKWKMRRTVVIGRTKGIIRRKSNQVLPCSLVSAIRLVVVTPAPVADRVMEEVWGSRSVQSPVPIPDRKLTKHRR